jgi:hypothetical protein
MAPVFAYLTWPWSIPPVGVPPLGVPPDWTLG